MKVTLYIPAGFYMLRAPALSVDAFKELSSTLTETYTHTSNLLDWLQMQNESMQRQILIMSRDPQVEQAIAVASSSLHASLVSLRSGEIKSSRMQKVYASLLRYMIRMSTRPTPFGLFSGISFGTFEEETHMQLDVPTIGHFHSRPDMHWLLALLAQIEASPILITQLSVYANQIITITGGRVLIPHRDSYGLKQNQAVSLRATAVVRKALGLARQPIPYIELRDKLLQAFSGVTIQQVEQLLQKLWEHGLLLSTLHPPLTNTQPMSYLSQHVETLHGIDNMRQILEDVKEMSAELDMAGIGGHLDSLTRLIQAQEALGVHKKQYPQIQIDSVLSSSSSTLHHRVGDIAAHAAELLLRITPHHEGSVNLKEYRTLFLERYGSNIEVPLLELLSPEQGLDAPSGYIQPSRTYNENRLSQQPLNKKREHVLHALVQEALNNHTLEIELAETNFAALETWSPDLQQAPLSLEIYMQLYATSQNDLDHGQWWAVISPNPGAPGGSTFGRFLDLLGDSERSTVQSFLRREETLEPDTIFAELNYQPWHARNANVAIRPNLRAFEIPIGTTPMLPPEQVILPQDLVVGIHKDRFYLRSLQHNKKVIVRQLHMLNPYQSPNVCRFLVDIATDGLPILTGFNWGSLSTAPFLPRITVQQNEQVKIILAPACWNLQASTIPLVVEGNTQNRWFIALQYWRKQWHVPRYVYLTVTDHRLLLDLEHPAMAAELLKELKNLKEKQQVTIQELLPDFDHLWLTDTQNRRYFSEIVVPLLRHDVLDAETSAQRQTIHPIPHVVLQQERVFYPGDAWNYIKLYCTPVQQQEILAGPLRGLIRQLREQHFIDHWFFIRYTDPQHHLRLRIHTSQREQIQPALNYLLDWSRQLATQGLIQRLMLDTYERETARYGGPAAIDLLEEIFCIDSEICSSLIAAQYTHRLTLDPLAIAVASLDRFFTIWNGDTEYRLHWLRQKTEKYAFRKEFHHERKRYYTLLASWDKFADPELVTQRAMLDTLITPQVNQISTLVTQVRTLKHAGQMWGTEEDLLASLAHMHNIRLLGIDRLREQQIYAFWRHTLEDICLHG